MWGNILKIIFFFFLFLENSTFILYPFTFQVTLYLLLGVVNFLKVVHLKCTKL